MPFDGWLKLSALYMLQKYFTGYLLCPQGRQMSGVLLAVDGCDPVFATKSDQGRQRNFGCIGNMRKHRLTKNCSTDGHAIEAPDQFTADPCFYAVCVPRAVQHAIGLNHGLQYPGPGLAVPWFAGTSCNDFRESRVKPDFTPGITRKTV